VKRGNEISMTPASNAQLGGTSESNRLKMAGPEGLGAPHFPFGGSDPNNEKQRSKGGEHAHHATA